ncbi:hypothetical protein CBR_g63129 [Chara braunii]|uniref:Translation elongation factor EF1B beta/delta subunit guanine nucleotide exchange domain-containing protein n=1 Tax=Chara braunii TaxID=69332 RepID=A0A388K943_CHABU|nr:hypothetical protein CBR_g63129 [Chara braunii]|eukprot:GBG66547.1 hypothetical protein CBR_g63129 [Chara braunii]
MGGVAFENLSSSEGVKALDDYLLTRSYITGSQASRDDLAVYLALKTAPSKEFVNASRWYSHITALLKKTFPGQAEGVSISGEVAAVSAPPPQTPETDAAEKDDEDEDDDDLDLFGEETEDEKAAREKREAQLQEAGKKPKVVAGKSSIVLDVKPWDDETDMKKLEEAVRAVAMPGLLWGASKLAPVGYGINKLQIMMTIEDDLVSVDQLIEDHLQEGSAAEYIQSVDIVAFNKI